MIQLIMPKMGESVAEATILKWLKNEGDRIEADEPVLEIATDKVDTEVPSPAAGVLNKKMFAEGQVVKVGEVIAFIAAENEGIKEVLSQPPTPPSAKPVSNKTAQVTEEKIFQSVAIPGESISKISPSGKFLSPLDRQF